jgi:hypothetical protein
MKATKKYDINIVALSEKLKPLSEKQIGWFQDKIHWAYGTKHYNSIICLECNHKWKGDFVKSRKTVQCPSCKKRLRPIGYDGYTTVDSHGVLFDRVGKIQVLRVIFIRKHLNKFQPPTYEVEEVINKWFDPEAKKVTLMSKTMNSPMGNYEGGWNLNSKLSLKKPNRGLLLDSKSTIYTDIYYPNKRIPKEIKRLGFTTKDIHRIPVDHLLQGLIENTRIETLMKKQSYVLLKKELYRPLTEKEWFAVRMCWKQNYDVKSYSDYFDYLQLLSSFGKDTKSPRWICPQDFHKAHQKLVKRKAKIDKAEREEKQRIDLIKHKEEAVIEGVKYIARNQKFFDLMFKSKNITISVMKSVEEFMTVGDELEHCIFTNRYYEKEHSLMLTAKVKGKLTETIEVNLDTMEVAQAKGYDNLPTKYNSNIIKIVEKNMKSIIKIYNKEAA